MPLASWIFAGLGALFLMGVVRQAIRDTRARRETLRLLKCRAAGEKLERTIRITRNLN